MIVGAGIGGAGVRLRACRARPRRDRARTRRRRPAARCAQVGIGGAQIDSGPTVFTMRWVFDELFAAAGRNFSDHVRLRPLDILARHAWDARDRLDLFADAARSADAIGDFAGAAEARGYRDFCRDTRRIYDTLEQPFMRAPQPSMGGLIGADGLARPAASCRRSRRSRRLWSALAQYFHDPRLRQLFGRYATYCGSSPFLAPATLMLVAHVERDGVWSIEGGMHAPRARRSRRWRASAGRDDPLRQRGRRGAHRAAAAPAASGLPSGERIAADAVIVNAESRRVASGLFGSAAPRGAAPRSRRRASLSAMTWTHASPKPSGFPLRAPQRFFLARLRRRVRRHLRPRQAAARADGLCLRAGSRRAASGAPARPRSGCLVLVNAPPNGDRHPYDAAEIEQCAQRTFGMLERCGLRIHRQPDSNGR